MKKEDLKKFLKPIIQECIKEVLLEEGVLSNIIKEVNKANGAKLVQEGNKAGMLPSKNVKDFGDFKMNLDGFKDNPALIEERKRRQQMLEAKQRAAPDFKRNGFSALIDSASDEEESQGAGVDLSEFFGGRG